MWQAKKSAAWRRRRGSDTNVVEVKVEVDRVGVHRLGGWFLVIHMVEVMVEEVKGVQISRFAAFIGNDCSAGRGGSG